MPLCERCRSHGLTTAAGMAAVIMSPLEPKFYPPYGMDWGERCSRCRVVAGVTFEEEEDTDD